MDDSDQNAIDGNASGSDYDLLSGGYFAAAQDPYSALDNGTINNAATGTGGASSAGTVTPPAGGSSYTPPSWLNGLLGLTKAAATAATTLSPIISGKPAVSPAAAGQTPSPSKTTVALGTTTLSNTMLLGIVGAVIAALFFIMRKKRV